MNILKKASITFVLLIYLCLTVACSSSGSDSEDMNNASPDSNHAETKENVEDNNNTLKEDIKDTADDIKNDIEDKLEPPDSNSATDSDSMSDDTSNNEHKN